MQALLDVVLSKAALTGKPYKGVYEVPISKVLGNKGEAGVSLKVLIIAKCEGRFSGEQQDNWFDSDPEHQ